MPRRKSSLADDLVGAPCWVSLVLALLAYGFSSGVANGLRECRTCGTHRPYSGGSRCDLGVPVVEDGLDAGATNRAGVAAGFAVEAFQGRAWRSVLAARVRSRRDTWRRSRWWRRFDSASRRRGYRRSMQTLERRPEVLGLQPLSGLPWYCGHLSDQGAEHLDYEPVCAFAERSCDLRHRTRRPRRGIIAKLSSEASCDARRAKDWYRASTMSR